MDELGFRWPQVHDDRRGGAVRYNWFPIQRRCADLFVRAAQLGSSLLRC